MTRLRLCIGCTAKHTPIDARYGMCDDCRRKKERTKASRRRRRTATERRRRQHLIDEYVKLNGWTCPGWNRPAHPSTDLTADHITPQAAGAAPESAIRVLCRTCNSSRGADTTATRPGPRPRFSRNQLTVGVGAPVTSKEPPSATPALARREKHSAEAPAEKSEPDASWAWG